MLDRKVVAITGGGRGIGRAHALACAAAGARVVVNDVGSGVSGEGGDNGPADEVVSSIREAGGDAVAQYGDISQESGARGVVAAALERWGRLDGVINNAGIVRDRMLFKMSVEEWDLVLNVHMRGTFLVSREACSHWRDLAKSAGGKTRGSIVNTSSTSGLLGVLGQTNYGAAKAGIAALTQILSMEMERYGVTCNALAPGARTRLAENAFPGLPSFEDRKVDPLAPESVAAVGVFLLSDEAAGITGHVFGIQGPLLQLYQGWTAVNTLTSDSGWSPKELWGRVDELFGDRSKKYEPPEEPFRALVADVSPNPEV